MSEFYKKTWEAERAEELKRFREALREVREAGKKDGFFRVCDALRGEGYDEVVDWLERNHEVILK